MPLGHVYAYGMWRERDVETTRLGETHTSQPGTMQAGKPGPGSLGPQSCYTLPVGDIALGVMQLTAESAHASLDKFQSSDTCR